MGILRSKQNMQEKNKTNQSHVMLSASTPPSILMSGVMLSQGNSKTEELIPHRTRGRKKKSRLGEPKSGKFDLS